jgi:hypothetical protein
MSRCLRIILLALLVSASLPAEDWWASVLARSTGAKDRIVVEIYEAKERPAAADAVEKAVAAREATRKPSEPAIIYAKIASDDRAGIGFSKALGFDDPAHDGWGYPDANAIYVLDHGGKCCGLVGYFPFGKEWCHDVLTLTPQPIDLKRRNDDELAFNQAGIYLQRICDIINGYQDPVFESHTGWPQDPSRFCVPDLGKRLEDRMRKAQQPPQRPKPAALIDNRENTISPRWFWTEVGATRYAVDDLGIRRVTYVKANGGWLVQAFSGFGLDGR